MGNLYLSEFDINKIQGLSNLVDKYDLEATTERRDDLERKFEPNCWEREGIQITVYTRAYPIIIHLHPSDIKYLTKNPNFSLVKDVINILECDNCITDDMDYDMLMFSDVDYVAVLDYLHHNRVIRRMGKVIADSWKEESFGPNLGSLIEVHKELSDGKGQFTIYTDTHVLGNEITVNRGSSIYQLQLDLNKMKIMPFDKNKVQDTHSIVDTNSIIDRLVYRKFLRNSISKIMNDVVQT